MNRFVSFKIRKAKISELLSFVFNLPLPVFLLGNSYSTPFKGKWGIILK